MAYPYRVTGRSYITYTSYRFAVQSLYARTHARPSVAHTRYMYWCVMCNLILFLNIRTSEYLKAISGNAHPFYGP